MPRVAARGGQISVMAVGSGAAACAPGVNFASPKSRTFAWPRVGNEDVGRLDVAMNDALRVGGVKGLGDLSSQIEQDLDLNRPASRCDA